MRDAKTTPTNPLAEKLYGPDDPTPAAESTHPDAEVADAMYRPDPYKSFSPGLRQPFAARADDHALVLGRSPEERLQHDRDFADVARKSGLDDYITERIYHEVVNADVAELRGAEADEGQLQRDAEETRAEVFATYGHEEGARWLAVANAFVKQHPMLATMLGRRGIGSRREIVIPILEHARRLHLQRAGQ